MKKGIIAIAIMIAFAAAMMMGSGAIAQTTKSGDVKDTMELKDSLFKKPKKSAVKFTHKQHSVDLKIKCTECHHVIKDGKNVWKDGDKVAMCATCHKSPTKNDGKMLSLKNAFHKNCTTCHKKMKKGPKKCNDCHPKKK
jgi:hypothetical protein